MTDLHGSQRRRTVYFTPPGSRTLGTYSSSS